MVLIDMLGRVHEACQQLQLSMSEREAASISSVHHLRMTLCASMAQVLNPILCVSDISRDIVAAFRKTALLSSLK